VFHNSCDVIKDSVKYLALALFGIVLAVFAIEFGVRLLPESLLPLSLRDLVHAMTFRAPGNYVVDPELGYLLPPATDFQSTNSEYSFRVKTNLNYDHAGFRGGTMGGAAWGVAVGDSFTFGIGVNQEATWEAQLARLSQREIVNLGVQGYGPQQYTQVLEKFGIALHPKVVFYCLFTNDLRDSEQYERWRRHPPPKFSVKVFLQNYSVLYNVIHQWRRARTQGSRYVDLHEVGQDLSLRKLRDEIVADSRRMATAWPLVARAIDKAFDQSRQTNTTLVVLYFPSKEEVYWDLIKQKMKSLEAFDDRVDQLKKATLQYCQSRQLICLDLTPALKRRAHLKEKLYFSIDTHWNELGHKVVAAEIYQFLVGQRLL
jgi:lysophospholipase L1-like esterase